MGSVPPLAVLFFIQGVVAIVYLNREGDDARFLRIQLHRCWIIGIAEAIFIGLHIGIHYLLYRLFISSEQSVNTIRLLAIAVSLLGNLGLGAVAFIIAQKKLRWIDRGSRIYGIIQCGICYLLWSVFVFLYSYSFVEQFIIAYYSIVFSTLLLILTALLLRMQVRGLRLSRQYLYFSRFIHLLLFTVGIYSLEFFLF